jgi:ribosomal protein L40E
MYGKADTEKPETTPMLPKTCQRCEMENPATAEYCLRCGLILDAKKAVELMSEDKTVNEQAIKKLQQKITELEKKNEELKQRLNGYSLSNEQIAELLRRIEKLEKQAQKQE